MKKLNKVYLLAIIMLIVVSCSSTQEEKAKLLFKSGFEDGVYIDSELVYGSEDYRFIRGTDRESGFSWPIDILGSSENALHYVSDDGDSLKATIESVKGHTGKPSRVLYNRMKRSVTGDTQLPYEILNVKDSSKDIYIRYWMKIDNNMIGQKNKWRALFEYKTKDYKDPGAGGTGLG